MKTIKLYRYEENGKVIITPNKAKKTDKPAKYRLVADAGMILQNGDTTVCAVDTYAPDDWVEIIDENYTEETI